jgi:hypothetical protein
MFEAAVCPLIHPESITDVQVDQDTRIGDVSQTGQWAPFNPHYGVSTLVSFRTYLMVVCKHIGKLQYRKQVHHSYQ